MSAKLNRRQLLLTTLAGGLAHMLPRVARAAASKRILLVGDSMIAGALGLFLERSLREQFGYEVQRKGKSSTGLARPDFFNWIKEAKRQIEAFPDADATVVMFGGNDVQGLKMGRGDNWIRWQEDGWRDEYARRVTEFADLVAPNGKHLFWIGMPVMRPEKFHLRVQRVNTIFRAEMAIRPGGHFVDIWRLLADENGNYADRIRIEPDAKKVRVRAGDGIHLSVAGAHHIKNTVRDVIHTTLEGPSTNPSPPPNAPPEPT